jgi:hypothetical protein
MATLLRTTAQPRVSSRAGYAFAGALLVIVGSLNILQGFIAP